MGGNQTGAGRNRPGCRKLLGDERGTVLIYVTIALGVFLGMTALAIDGGRLFTLQTELQSGADAIALAGAAELDGLAGARDRADAAMANLVANDQTFATGPSAIQFVVANRRFLSAIPNDDQAPSGGTLATGDADARFVQVTLTPRDNENLFAQAIGGGATATTGANATAGFTQAVCKFTPLFICNPYEGNPGGVSLSDAIADPTQRRRLIELHKGPGGGNSSLFPGNFGFLQPADGRGAGALRDSVARVDPGTCFEQSGVHTKTGMNNVATALNTRFDLYENPGYGGNTKNDPDFRPALNVTKGYMPGTGNGSNGGPCAAQPDTTQAQAYSLPKDNCFPSGCAQLGGSGSTWNGWGDGDWNFDKYWDMNHGNRNGVFADDGVKPNGWSNSNLPPRYDVYRWEIDNNAIPNKSSVGGENGNPACHTANDLSDTPDRRIVYAAVLNCGSLGIHGGDGGPYPVFSFIKMFVTEPMSKLPGNDPNTDYDRSMFVEIVDIVQPGIDDEVVHDVVQLYR